MIKCIISIVVFSFFSVTGFTQQWVSVSGKGGAVELDRASVINVDDGVQAWSRLTQEKQSLGPEDGFLYRRLVQLNEYYCGKRAYAVLQRMYFDDRGLLVKEQRYSEAEDSQRVVPSTPEDRMYKMVCPTDRQNNRRGLSNIAQSPEERVKTELRNQNAQQGSQQSLARSTPSIANTGQAASPQAATEKAEKKTAPQSTVVKPAKTTAPTTGGHSGITGLLSRLLPSHVPVQSSAGSVAIAPSRKPSMTLGQAQPATASTKPIVITPEAGATTERTTQSAGTQRAHGVTSATSATKLPEIKSQTTVAQANTSGSPANLDKRPTDGLSWLYQENSPKGPSKWSSLSSANQLCSAGLMQAPINIRNAVVADMDPIRFGSKPVQLRITDTGNTIMVKVDPGVSLTWQNVKYDLLYYTFHSPSEIQVEGKSHEMSIHFIHRSLQGKVTVLAVPVKIGKENPAIRQIWNNLPLERGIEGVPVGVMLNPRDIIDTPDSISDVVSRSKVPPNRLKGYYVFVGSLSTPPCTEGVLWLVLKEPIEISAEQYRNFGRLYENNVRPIQPSRGRLIKATRY